MSNNIKIGDQVIYHGEVYEVKGFRTLAVRYLDIGIGFYVNPVNVGIVPSGTYHSNVVSLTKRRMKKWLKEDVVTRVRKRKNLSL